MIFFEGFVFLLICTIGTIVGGVLTLAFGMPMAIIKTWFEDNAPEKFKVKDITADRVVFKK